MRTPAYWLEALERGLTKEEIEAEFVRDGQTLDVAQVSRMNLIGGFRVQGHIIERKGGIYRLVGFKEKEDYLPASEWPEEQQAVLKWFNLLPEVTLRDYEWLSRQINAVNITPLHEYCPGYVLSYELANDIGRKLPGGGIIARRFEEQPRFRIIFPPLPERAGDALRDVVAKLRLVSRKNIRLVGAHPGDDFSRLGFKRGSPKRQAVYRISDLAGGKHLEHLSKSTRAQVRKSLKDLKIDWIHEGNEHDAYRVLDLWKAGPAGQKQRQLAIGRDYEAVRLCAQSSIPGPVGFLFYREGAPVGVEIYDRINDTYVAHLVAKALNYTSQPGGYGSTSTATLMLAAQRLSDEGYFFINGGTYAGGTEGLVAHKKVLAADNDDIVCYDWEAPNTAYTPHVVASVGKKDQAGAGGDSLRKVSLLDRFGR